MKNIKNFGILFIASLLLSNCVDQDRFDVVIDDRIDVIGEYAITPKNPETGEDYTEEELNELNYNPSEEEFYFKDQPVEVAIWTIGKPLKVEIKKSGDPTVVETLENAVESNNGYLFNWSNTLEALGVDEGSLVTFNLVIIYDDAGSNGFDYNSAQAIPFTVHHKTAKQVAPLVILQRSLSDITPLNTEGNISGSGIEEGIGAYVVLDGIDDYVTITDALDFTGNSDFSISLWVNTTSLNDDPAIISNKDWSGGGNKGFVIAQRGSKDIKLVGGDGVGGRLDVYAHPINDGEWHHLTATFDIDGNMSLYRDGEIVYFEPKDQFSFGDISNFTSDMNSGFPIRIGQDGTGAYGLFYEGKVGGVVINDYVLSSGEVKRMAGVSTGVELRTEEFWAALDLESGASETITEEGMTYGVYDGVDDFSTIIDNGALDFRFDQDFSFAVWVKTTAPEGPDPSLIGDKDWNGGGNKGFTLSYRGKDLKMNLGDGENRVDVKGPAINDDNWHLVMGTFDRDGDAVLYVDGVAVNAGSMAAIADMNSGMPIRIAQDGTSTYGSFFPGNVGRIYFFDYAVTASEALMLYQE